jgi:hypothetical protein
LFEEHFVKLYTYNRPRDPRAVARIENANDANEENNAATGRFGCGR